MKVPEGKDINDLEQHEFEKIYSEREIVWVWFYINMNGTYKRP